MNEQEFSTEFIRFLNSLEYGIISYSVSKTSLSTIFVNDYFLKTVKLDKEVVFKSSLKDNSFFLLENNYTVDSICKLVYNTKSQAEGYGSLLASDGTQVPIHYKAFSFEYFGKRLACFTFDNGLFPNNYTGLFSTIFNSLSLSFSIFIVHNKIPKFVFANDYFFKLLNVTRNEYLKDPERINQMIVSLEDQKLIKDAWTDTILTHKTQERVFQLHLFNQEPIWIQQKFIVKKTDDGDDYYFISFVSDITERKKQEEKERIIFEQQTLVLKELKVDILEWYPLKQKAILVSDFTNYYVHRVNDNFLSYTNVVLDNVDPLDQDITLEFMQLMELKTPRIERDIRFKMLDGSYQSTRVLFILVNNTFYRGIYINIQSQKETELKLSSVLDAIPGGVAIYKVMNQGGIESLYFSDGVPKLTGRTREEYEEWIKDGLYNNTIFGEDLEKTKRIVSDCSKNEKDIHVLYRLIHKSGYPVWIQFQAKKISEEKDYKIYYGVYLLPSEEAMLYRGILDDSMVSVFVADKETFKILYVNNAWKKMYRYPKTETCVGHHISEFIPNSTRVITKDVVKTLKKDVFDEKDLVLFNSEYYHLYTRAVTWNGVESFIVYSVNQTEVVKSKKEFEKLTNEVPTGIGIFHISNHILNYDFLNDFFLNMFAPELRNRFPLPIDYVYKEDHKVILKTMELLESNQDDCDIIIRTIPINGETHWFRILGRVINRTNERIDIYCAFTSIDELKNIQNKLENTKFMLASSIQSANIKVWEYNPITREFFDPINDTSYVMI